MGDFDIAEPASVCVCVPTWCRTVVSERQQEIEIKHKELTRRSFEGSDRKFEDVE